MDATTFLGARIPTEIPKLFAALQKLKPSLLSPLLVLVSSNIKGTEIADSDFEKIATQLGVDKATLSVVFAGLLQIIRAAVKSRIKPEDLEKDLQELKAPQAFSQEFVKLMKNEQSAFEGAFGENKIRYPNVEDCKWRVDVAVSSNTLSRVLKPTVSLQLTTSDDNIKTFEMNVEQFQELRYQVSKVLKEMQDIEKFPILKIQ